MRKSKENIILTYLNLNLKKLPNCLKNSDSVDIKSTELQSEKDYKVYKFININDINIVLTNTHRLDEPSNKTKNMNVLSYYFDPKNEEEYVTLMNIINTTSIKSIEEIEENQKKFSKKLPIKVKYEKDYLWQIYYIKRTNKYYMIVPTQETNQEAFLYILKKQIEDSNEKIYVPICNLNYQDGNKNLYGLAKYLNAFTNEWPMIYEAYDNKDKRSIVITGILKIYENIVSDYRMEFKTNEELNNFELLLEILFRLKLELSDYFKFEIRLNNKGIIRFYFNNNELTISNINEFYDNEIKQTLKNIEEITRIEKELRNRFNELKVQERNLNSELLNKQKQISTFLECKKTFLGKIKYFLRSNKKSKPVLEEVMPDISSNASKKDNEYETYNANIEDLICICRKFILFTTEATTTKLDIQNLNIRIDILKKKIENADLYIKEIESHKKSIFEFWKFTNKDEQNQLNEGVMKKEREIRINKDFNISENLEEFAKNIDLIQRQRLTRKRARKYFGM